MSREAEIAWAAGLFEGEGTFTYSPNHVRAQLNMTDFGPVERFCEIVGVGTLVLKPALHHKDQLLWRVTDRAGVQHVYDLLRPWLSSRRIAQAEDALRQLAEGVARTEAKRDATCRNGHPRTRENTYQYLKNGRPARACNVCRVEATRRSRARQRDQLAATLEDALKGEL